MGPNGKPLLEDGRGPTYIPNMPASKFEMMINRNMTAAYIGHNYDAKLRNIHVVGMIDGVISEPIGGAHRDKELILNNVRSSIVDSLNEFKNMHRE